MVMTDDYILELSKLKYEEFDRQIDEALSIMSDEEKLTFLYMLKKEIKDEKESYSTTRRLTTNEEDKFHLKNRIKKLKKKISLLNYKIRCVNPTKEKVVRAGILNGKQKRIKRDIYNEEDISRYNIRDQIITFDYLIIEEFNEENYDLFEKYSLEISYSMSDYIINNETFKEFYIFLHDLKYRINKSGKETKERNVLKKIFNNFKQIYQIYKKKVEEDNLSNTNSSYYDVISYWINSEENYNYIKALLERKSEAVNTIYNGKHIVFHILEFYIHNFKRMVNDKKSDYVNLKYIEEVYYLFTKSPALRLSKQEKELIDIKIKEFEEYIDNTLIKQKRKNYAKSICKSMKSNKFYNDIYYYEFPGYDDDLLGCLQISLTNGIDSLAKRKEPKNAYIYDDKVYNISVKEDGKIVLNMYAISFYNFIVRDGDVDKYLEKCEMQKEEIDSFFKKELVLKKDGVYPVIDYELEFYPSGKLCGLSVKEDVIRVKQMDEEKYNELEELYKKSVVKNEDDKNTINSHFENMLQKAYIGFIRENALPFIYYGKTMPDKNEIEKTINDLSSDLYDMEKKDYADIINIISNEVDIYHYSNLPIKNADYELNLLNPISYLGIENQRMLADLYFNIRKFSNKERLRGLKVLYVRKYFDKVCELNSNLGYVDSNVIKQKRGKIKNRVRI